MAEYFLPIWKNTFYTSTDDELEYSIYDVAAGKTIFNGRGYKFPDATELKICVNKICQNYLGSDVLSLLQSTDDQMEMTDTCRCFSIENASGETLDYYYFMYDWSYKDVEWNPDEDRVLSRPVNGHYVSGMHCLDTYWNAEEYLVYTEKNSTSYNVLSCGDYALYYLNSYGGWDSFLIEGNVKRTDTLTNSNYEQTPARVLTDWGTTRYATEIQPAYTLVTGWLTDEQSENVASNLLTSPKVYMHNLKDNTITPVLITDTSIEHKTYSTNGKQLNSYTIKVNESQTRYRR